MQKSREGLWLQSRADLGEEQCGAMNARTTPREWRGLGWSWAGLRGKTQLQGGALREAEGGAAGGAGRACER